MHAAIPFFSRFDDRLNQGLEGAKWLAVVLMALCHLGIAIGGELTLPAFWVGRVCAPIFCFIIVARLSEKPAERTNRYLIRLSVWAVVAQLPYSLWTINFGFHFNVLVTLALGVGLIWIWLKGYPVIAVLLAIASLIPAVLFDMGLVAVSIMLLGFVLYRNSPKSAMFAISLGYALEHLYARPHDLWAPALCMLSPFAVALCGLSPSRFFRLPGWMFYGFYPAHIALIFLAFGPCLPPET